MAGFFRMSPKSHPVSWMMSKGSEHSNPPNKNPTVYLAWFTELIIPKPTSN
jgi:hypothetical protein